MTILDIASQYTTLRQHGNRHAGACPICGGDERTSDRFNVYADKGYCHCFGCGFNGDAVAFVKRMENLSCPDAHDRVGKACDNPDCPVWDNCRLGGRDATAKPRPRKKQALTPPQRQQEQRPYTPAQAEMPQQQWADQAALLIEKSHQRLIDNADQLAFLAGRGIPQEAVERGKLGFVDTNKYPRREDWGLETERKSDGKAKKYFVPSGILIPFFSGGAPHRIRIRRDDPRPQDPRYYWLVGSGDDVPVIGPHRASAVVVVESDLDAFMVRWHCRDLDVAVIPLGTCSAKPKQAAFELCRNALVILVAHDFEPRINEKTGKPENPGGQGAKWWLQQFKRCKRWPVPQGKDPGDYYKDHGGNIRDWIVAGLPPACHITTPEPPPVEKQPPPPPRAWKLCLKDGREIVVVEHLDDKKIYAKKTGLPVLTKIEIEQMKHMDAEARNAALLALTVFGVDTTVIDYQQEVA